MGTVSAMTFLVGVWGRRAVDPPGGFYFTTTVRGYWLPALLAL
jgi:hypothetical protein